MAKKKTDEWATIPDELLPENESVQGETPAQPLIIGTEEIKRAAETLVRYKAAKYNYERRIVENEQWWRMRHWDVVRNKAQYQSEVEPTSGWLFHSICGKHADLMDNFPEPAILPREQDDKPEAERLCDIVPLILEQNNFEKTYSDAGFYKIKNGTCAFGVFWNKDLNNGLGDIDVTTIDMLNLFWQPGVKHISQSENLFIVNLVDDSALVNMYPFLEGKLGGEKVLDVTRYNHDDTVDVTDKSLVVDWYYKVKRGTRTLLHYCKFVGEELLFASENEPAYVENGFYDHGEYPVVLDMLFPEEGMPIGFGYVDVMKDAQMYIDKLNQIILKNAMMVGKKRWFVPENSNINVEEFADWDKPFVHVEGGLQALSDEGLREIQVAPLPAFVSNHLMMKIDELKETSGNRDFSQGGTSGGVTAASAILALQEAGNKMSRDMIKGSYRAYCALVYLVIENIRQFYSEGRPFRVARGNGAFEFTRYNNQNLQEVSLNKAFDGQILPLGLEKAVRKPLFDIKVRPQKSNPFSRLAQNDFAKELLDKGFFKPEMIEQAIMALNMMDFEGKDALMALMTSGHKRAQTGSAKGNDVMR